MLVLEVFSYFFRVLGVLAQFGQNLFMGYFLWDALIPFISHQLFVLVFLFVVRFVKNFRFFFNRFFELLFVKSFHLFPIRSFVNLVKTVASLCIFVGLSLHADCSGYRVVVFCAYVGNSEHPLVAQDSQPFRLFKSDCLLRTSSRDQSRLLTFVGYYARVTFILGVFVGVFWRVQHLSFCRRKFCQSFVDKNTTR